MFSKIPAIAYGQRRIFELCYKIGNFALDDRQYDNAAKWLERALSAWELYHSHMAQSIDNDELLILHATSKVRPSRSFRMRVNEA